MFSSDSSLCSSQVLRKSQALRRKVTEKRGEWGGEHRAEIVPEQADALENTWKAPRPSEALLQPPFFRPSGNQWPLWCAWSPVPGDLLSSAKAMTVMNLLVCRPATARAGCSEHWPLGSRQAAEKQAQVGSVCLPLPAHTWHTLPRGVHPPCL